MVGDSLPDSWVLPGYEHVQLLGSGAGGHVWLAVHRGSGTLVAVKYLVPGLHASADFREAYRGEAELLAALDSPHVTRLYEYVEGPPGAAIVMEAVEGSSLREVLRRERAAGSPEAALCVLKGSLLGLAAAHEAGVVHRDFKPANVLVTPQGRSKLVDFGIAARTGEAAPAAGTPLYMAPEQFHGAPASPAADVYAATVTFFECVTGERPFPGANAVELMAQHTLGTIPDDLVPEPLRVLIRRGMAKSPLERPATARRFVAELEAVAGAAYGEEWERRGQHKLATVLALFPLLLLAGISGAAQAGGTAIATTVLGDGGEVTLGPTGHGPQAGGGGGSGGGGGGGGGTGNTPEPTHGGGTGHDVHRLPPKKHHKNRHQSHHQGHEHETHHDTHHEHDGHHDKDAHHEHHGNGKDQKGHHPRRRRTMRWAVGGGGALIIAAAGVVAAAAYGSHNHTTASASGGGGSEIGALTGATTLISPSESPNLSTVLSTSASASPSTSATPSTSASTTASSVTTSSTSPTTPGTSVAPTTPTASATRTTQSPSASPTPPPQIISLSFNSVGCQNDVPTVTAIVSVTSNGGAGTVTFSWFQQNAATGGEQLLATTTASVAAGKTTQTVTSSENLSSASLYDTWGVTITSSPAAERTPGSYTFNPSGAQCGVIIQ